MITIGEPWMWGAFIAFMISMLALDLFAFGSGKAHRVSVKEAAIWSAVWVVLALSFNGLLWWHLDQTSGSVVANQKAMEFLSGYIIEKSLSIDNVFVFLMIFGAFHIPIELQRRVLLYGVIGAICLRAVMIIAGAWIVREYDWVLYIFGAFLVITGIRMLVMAEHVPDLEKNPILKFARRHLRVTKELHGERFKITQNGVKYFTPLFLVLLLIEGSDVVFAVDSIPAVFAVTTDPFIVFTSNIFAIMGLRALYFLLADMAERFHLLKYGLAFLLIFIGGKMIAAHWIHVPIQVSLLVIGLILSTSVIASLMSKNQTKHESN
jgi:tellurite resistance protein TerC